MFAIDALLNNDVYNGGGLQVTVRALVLIQSSDGGDTAQMRNLRHAVRCMFSQMYGAAKNAVKDMMGRSIMIL